MWFSFDWSLGNVLHYSSFYSRVLFSSYYSLPMYKKKEESEWKFLSGREKRPFPPRLFSFSFWNKQTTTTTTSNSVMIPAVTLYAMLPLLGLFEFYYWHNLLSCGGSLFYVVSRVSTCRRRLDVHITPPPPKKTKGSRSQRWRVSLIIYGI